MRVLVLFAHPVETSFGAAVHKAVLSGLAKGGHQIDDCDLNAEGFNPVMSRQDRLEYHDVSINRTRVAPYVERLLAADALALSYPVWNMGFPAILKGFVDKVFLPGVSFTLNERGDYKTNLNNIKRLGAACTYGGDKLRTFIAGDPCKRFVTRSLRFVCAPGAKCDYVALHDMNHTRADRRAAFLTRVERTFSAW